MRRAVIFFAIFSLIEITYGQAIGCNNRGPNLPIGNGLAPGVLGNGLGPANLAGMPIPSPAGYGDVAIVGELPVGGSTAVIGNVPIIGFVTFEGIVPANGMVSLASNCDCNPLL